MKPLRAADLGRAIPRRGNRCTRWLGRRILAALGLRLQGSLPDVPKMVAIGAPHTSNWDGVMAIGVALALSIDVRVIAKVAIFRWPFARLLRWMGVIGIERTRAADVVGEVTALFAARESLILCIAPEGTRGGATVWKSGFHRMALAARVPILVLVFDWGAGVVRFADHFEAGPDYAADLQRILEHYRGVGARRPERLSAPLRLLSGQTPTDHPPQ